MKTALIVPPAAKLAPLADAKSFWRLNSSAEEKTTLAVADTATHQPRRRASTTSRRLGTQ
jgi:hypothetical protein